MTRTFFTTAALLASLTMSCADDKPIPAPELIGVSEWINSKSLKLADLKGKVVFVHFWTHGCINCVRNYEHYRDWTTQFEKVPEFAMIGIHTPEFDSEKNGERIKQKAKDNKLTFPIAVDNDSKNWQAWGNQYWSCVYLVDKQGNVRYRWAGELGKDGMKTVTAEIEKLLKEAVKS